MVVLCAALVDTELHSDLMAIAGAFAALLTSLDRHLNSRSMAARRIFSKCE